MHLLLVIVFVLAAVPPPGVELPQLPTKTRALVLDLANAAQVNKEAGGIDNETKACLWLMRAYAVIDFHQRLAQGQNKPERDSLATAMTQLTQQMNGKCGSPDGDRAIAATKTLLRVLQDEDRRAKQHQIIMMNGMSLKHQCPVGFCPAKSPEVAGIGTATLGNMVIPNQLVSYFKAAKLLGR